MGERFRAAGRGKLPLPAVAFFLAKQLFCTQGIQKRKKETAVKTTKGVLRPREFADRFFRPPHRPGSLKRQPSILKPAKNFLKRLTGRINCAKILTNNK